MKSVILRGILALARLRPEGFDAFGASTQALLNSLAPLLAFPLVGGVIELLSGQVAMALSDVLAAVVALVTPLVVTEFLAERWGRGGLWLRFAVASNWCQWVLPALLVAIVMGIWLLSGFGMPVGRGLVVAAVLGLVAYGLVLHWFLARVGLELSRGRALVLVLSADLLTGLLVLGPRLLGGSVPGAGLP